MSRRDKRFRRVTDAHSIAPVRFIELCAVLRGCGFDERVRGSHHIFTRDDIREMLNLQPRSDGYVKRYQLLQVRAVFIRYGVVPGDLD